jgi:alpha-tubulin suppressor-like RCC1 family protein
MRTRSILRLSPLFLCAAVVLSACAERVITGATAEPERPRLTVTPTIAFDSIDSGLAHSCALTSGGLAYCWGRNSLAQLGDSSFATRTTPVAVRMPRDANGAVIPFEQLSAGWSHSCAVDANGQAWCWGYNADRRLGDSTTANPRKPIKVKPYGAIAFTQVTTGDQHSCGIDGSGDAHCWGDNDYGQLGDSTVNYRFFPTPVVMPAGVSFEQITTGEVFTCALDGAGQAWCWGYGADGRTGDGSAFGEPIPSAVQQGGVTFVEISANFYHACGVTSAGQAYCWGVNTSGQLGDGTTSDQPTPVAVLQPGGVTFVRVTTGSDHSCGITLAGQMYCWGGNGAGQLGDGSSPTPSLTPVAVSHPTGITFGPIAAGGNFSCALDDVNDQAYCWGTNGFYQLGDGTTTPKNTPNPVSH